MTLQSIIKCQNGTKLFERSANIIYNLVGDSMRLKEYREALGITIKEASSSINVPLRTYIRYENDDNYGNVLKRNSIYELLKSKFEITEDKGLLTIDTIVDKVNDLLGRYSSNVEFCYLFGSYAKGSATEKSDVDLCISTSLKGFEFVGLLDEIRNTLMKKVDLIRFSDLEGNFELVKEIFKDGIKIY